MSEKQQRRKYFARSGFVFPCGTNDVRNFIRFTRLNFITIPFLVLSVRPSGIEFPIYLFRRGCKSLASG